MRLQLEDPAYTERLVDFLQSVGQASHVVGPGRVELEGDEDEAWRLEIDLYVRVWRVMHPMARIERAPDIPGS